MSSDMTINQSDWGHGSVQPGTSWHGHCMPCSQTHSKLSLGMRPAP